jgi:glycosyltransferase involved in cell wall biosynthesis
MVRSAPPGMSDRQTPSLLAVSSQIPWPLNSGGHIRTFHLLRALAQVFRVHLLIGSTDTARNGVAELADAGIHCELVPIAGTSLARDALTAARSRMSGHPYVLYGRHYHRRVHQRARDICRVDPPAVLYLDHLDSLGYADSSPGSLRVLDLHNVYSLIAARGAEGRGLLARSYLRGEARLLRSVESDACAAVDLIFAVSEQERAYYERLGRAAVHLVPNGVDCDAYAGLPTGRPGRSLILYVGTMSWEPNARAASYLATHVFPAVRRRYPDAHLRVVGRNPPDSLRALDIDGVEVVGEVPSLAPHLDEAAVLAVPLEVGGGTRLKILEALAAGLPVISTPIGAEGLDLVSDEHLVIAGHEQFTGALITLLGDVDTATRLATAGRAAVRVRYDWKMIGASAADAITSADRQRGR